MDHVMNQRWQSGLPPFDGDCLVTRDIVTVEELRKVLSAVVQLLQMECIETALYAFDDWHQHDGYVTERREIEWKVLEAVTRSVEDLMMSRQGDDYVYRAFYPADLSFLLRYDISDEECGDGSGFSGVFDLSASRECIARAMSSIRPGILSKLRIESAKAYFDVTYSG